MKQTAKRGVMTVLILSNDMGEAKADKVFAFPYSIKTGRLLSDVSKSVHVVTDEKFRECVQSIVDDDGSTITEDELEEACSNDQFTLYDVTVLRTGSVCY